MLLTIMASVWMQHGGAFQSHLRMATTLLDATRYREPTASLGPAPTVTFVKQLVRSVSEFLRVSVIPRWESRVHCVRRDPPETPRSSALCIPPTIVIGAGRIGFRPRRCSCTIVCCPWTWFPWLGHGDQRTRRLRGTCCL